MKFRFVACLLGALATLASAADPKATPEEARRFINDAEQKLMVLGVDASRADWIKSTYITDDTEALAAKLDERAIAATVDYAKKATRFDGLKLDPVTARKLKLLKLSLTIATPSDPRESEELTRIVTGMEGAYGKGKFCPSGPDSCQDLEQLSKTLAESRNPDELLKAWTGWHAISRPMRNDFIRYVALANKGASQLGFKDNGAMWRSKYDMDPDAFARELDRLWEQVKPLYLELHAYVRAKLRAKYGDIVPTSGPIPAYLLGNMWAQDWDNIYALVEPPNADPGYDLTKLLMAHNTGWKQMVKYGENFFTSLGFDPLPQTFWERSLFLKPCLSAAMFSGISLRASRRTMSGTRILPMPWPVKSTLMVSLDRESVTGSTRTSTVARIGPSVPRTPQVRGGSMCESSEMTWRLAPPMRRVVTHFVPTCGSWAPSAGRVQVPAFHAFLPLAEQGRVGGAGEDLGGRAVDFGGGDDRRHVSGPPSAGRRSGPGTAASPPARRCRR